MFQQMLDKVVDDHQAKSGEGEGVTLMKIR
jgi:hypothetical protein